MKKIYTLATCYLLLTTCAFAQKKEITLDDIFAKGTFSVKHIYGLESMKDGEHYTTLANGKSNPAIVKYEYKTGNAVDTILKEDWLLTPDKKEKISIENYSFSADEKKILIATETEPIYRHSTRENYYIWNRETKKLSALSSGGKQSLAEFSPDGNKVAFVRENNLFFVDLSSGKETQITKDGKVNSIINGATDWVYEEEFSFSKAWFWSPDGNKIAYYRFDESNVKEFSMNKYGTLYPTEYKFKYPKAGEDNSKVSIHVFYLDSQEALTLNLDAEYIPRIKWSVNPNLLSVQTLNRLQNKLELYIIDCRKNHDPIKPVITETSDTYIEIADALTFLPNGKEFIWSSEKDGHNHLYLYDINAGFVSQITKGDWDVIDLKGYDEKKQTLYYLSTEISPNNRNLYSISIEGKNKKKLFPLQGTDDAEFNTTFTYYIHTFSNANHLPTIVLRTADGNEVRTLEDNAALQKKLSDYNLTTKEFFKFKTEDGTELNGWMMKPAASKEDGNKKRPVLMFVYGGPGINTVNDAWDRDYFWYQMLCEKGYIIVSVDNRGTGGRGKKFRDCTYKQLGKLETEDQISAAKYLGTLPYVDKNRIGIWGWSYGGYMSSLCIMKGADVFKMAMAVAPVTNWRYYDNVYTERYMGLPKDNGSGYDDNSPINHVDKLKGKFLLVHGTADDNVHFQNSVEMVTALVKANKQFDFFAYPDKAHSLSGRDTHLHLYNMLTNFVLNNL